MRDKGAKFILYCFVLLLADSFESDSPQNNQFLKTYKFLHRDYFTYFTSHSDTPIPCRHSASYVISLFRSSTYYPGGLNSQNEIIVSTTINVSSRLSGVGGLTMIPYNMQGATARQQHPSYGILRTEGNLATKFFCFFCWGGRGREKLRFLSVPRRSA